MSRRDGFWSGVEAAKRTAALQAARFEGDTPARELRRKAEALVLPSAFNAHYLPHYFRGTPSPVHAFLHLVLQWEHHAAVRIPRGFAKSTTVTFAYPLHQVVCAPVLRAWKDGTLEATQPELYRAICEVMAEESARRIAAGPLTTRSSGLPDHWDPSVIDGLDAWLQSVYDRQVALGNTLPLHWDPFIQIVAVDLDLSLEFTGAIRKELDLNDLIRGDWGDLTCCKTGDWTRKLKRQASDEDFESNAVRVAAYSMQEEIRGGKHGAFRPTLAIFDDPDGEKTSRTLNQRDGNEQMIGGAVENGLEPGVGRVMVCGTPHHPDCVVVRLTEKDEHKEFWVSFRFRARDDDSRLLWPSRFTAEIVESKFKRNPEKAEPELDDRPPSLGARPFKRVHRYSREAYAKMALSTVMAFDPSGGRTASSDYQAIVVLRGPTPGDDPKILVHRCELWRKPDPEELVDSVNEVYNAENPDMAVAEAIGLGSILQMLLTSRGRRAHIFPGWKRIERQAEGKDFRVTGMAPLINGGSILFPDDGSCRALEQQFLQWGESGAKRDGPDALHMALEQVRQLARPRAEVRHTSRPRAAALEALLGRDTERRARFGQSSPRRMEGWR